jgi:hypothetical protein
MHADLEIYIGNPRNDDGNKTSQQKADEQNRNAVLVI